MSMFERILSASTSSPRKHEPRLLQRAGDQAERLRQHDPLDLPRSRRALVIGDHRVHQRRRMLAHDRDRGVDVAARDRIALLRHRAARSAARRERLVHLGDLVLHHQLDVHRDLAERPAHEAEEGADVSAMVSRTVCQAMSGVPQAQAPSSGRAAFPSRPLDRRERAARAAELADQHARPQLRESLAVTLDAGENRGHLEAERHRDRLLQIAAPDDRRVAVAAREFRERRLRSRRDRPRRARGRRGSAARCAVSVMSCVVAPQ